MDLINMLLGVDCTKNAQGSQQEPLPVITTPHTVTSIRPTGVFKRDISRLRFCSMSVTIIKSYGAT